MKDHVLGLIGLFALTMILGAAIVMAVHGIKEDALLIILLQGAVNIGLRIVDAPIKPPPGTKIETASTVTTPVEEPKP